MAISWCDSVDGGVKGQPALATEVVPKERKQKGVTTMTEQLQETPQGIFLCMCISMS